jgi:hypothetical protein
MQKGAGIRIDEVTPAIDNLQLYLPTSGQHRNGENWANIPRIIGLWNNGLIVARPQQALE